MKWSISVVTPPASNPVTLAEMEAHLRILASEPEESALISSLIEAATELIQDQSRRTFVDTVLALVLDDFPDNFIQLRLGPVSLVSSVKYTLSDGTETTLDASNYFTTGDRIHLGYGVTWPSAALRPAGAVKVTYTAGYGTASDVPEKYKAAIKLLVAHWFENREQVVLDGVPRELPFAVKALVDADRNWTAQ